MLFSRHCFNWHDDRVTWLMRFVWLGLGHCSIQFICIKRVESIRVTFFLFKLYNISWRNLILETPFPLYDFGNFKDKVNYGCHFFNCHQILYKLLKWLPFFLHILVWLEELSMLKMFGEPIGADYDPKTYISVVT